MIALYIILAVLALIFLLLLLPVRLSLIFRDELSLTASYLFVHIPIYPKEKAVRPSDYSPRKLRKRKKKLKKKRQLQKAAAAKKASKPKVPLKQRIRQLRLILYILKNVYKNILSAVHVRVKRLYVRVATEDAAKTAILYGVAAQGTSYLLQLLHDHTKTTVKRGGADVIADFCGTESSLDADILFSVRPISVLYLGLRAAFFFLKHKLTSPDKKQKTE